MEQPAGTTAHASGWFDTLLHYTTLSVEAAGVAAIVIGALFAAITSLRLLGASGEASAAYHEFRLKLGRAILLGLELLVAADIIGTVAIEPSLDNVLILAVIVLIRTFLSISLTVEIEGRWPWQAARSTAERVHRGGENS